MLSTLYWFLRARSQIPVYGLTGAAWVAGRRRQAQDFVGKILE